MLYRNIKNGAEIETTSIISAPNWIAVGADAPDKKAETKAEAPKESEETPIVEEKTEAKPVKKTASKKTVKRTKK